MADLMALDAAALGGEGDVDKDLPLEEGGEHGAKVGQVVVPAKAVVLRRRRLLSAHHIHPAALPQLVL